MWSIARFDLGLTDSEFGVITPALFDKLLNRKEQQDKLLYVLTGIIASTVVNWSMGAPDKKATVIDFIPKHYLADGEGEVDLTKMSPEDQIRYVKGQLSKRVYRRR